MTKEEENQYRRDTYHWRKAHKMCGRCGKQDAYTLNGRSKCCECCEKENQNRRKNYDPEKEHEKKQRQYAKRETEGKCVRCGRVKSDNGRKICNKCIAEKHQYNQERSKDIRVYRHDLNLCWFCGSQLDGQKKFDGTQSRICSRCYESRLPYMHKAIEQSIKNREERKPIMNTQEIIEGYTKANTKSNYINKTAKSLKKPKSHIIAELFKSGYKYIELQRSFPNEYAAAEKIYQKWLEEGGQDEEVQPDQEEQTEEIQNSEPEVTELKQKNEELSRIYQLALNDVVKLTDELNGVKEAIDTLTKDKEELEENLSATEKINLALVAENEKLEEEMRMLNEVINKHAERIRELEADKNESDEGLEGMDEEINNVVAELSKAKMKISQLDTDLDTTTGMYLKERKKRKKLEKAFLKLVTK